MCECVCLLYTYQQVSIAQKGIEWATKEIAHDVDINSVAKNSKNKKGKKATTDVDINK